MTLFAELNGAQIAEGRITIPAYGAPHADVTLVKELPSVAPGSPLVVGDLTLTMTPWRPVVPFQGKTRLRMIGGFGGWRSVLPPFPYKLPQGVKLSLVLGDAARSVKEKLVLGEDRSLGKFYVRERAPASRLLNSLVPNAWWIDPDGTTRTGARASSTIASTFTVVSFDGARGVASIATEHLKDFVPGRTMSGGTLATMITIDSIVHTISKGAIRTEVLAA